MDTVALLEFIIVCLFLSFCLIIAWVLYRGKKRLGQIEQSIESKVVSAANEAEEAAPLISVKVKTDMGPKMTDVNEQLICTHNIAFQQAVLCAAHLAESVYDSDKRPSDRLGYNFGREWITYQSDVKTTSDDTYFVCAYQLDMKKTITYMSVVIRGTASADDVLSDATAFPIGLNGTADKTLWGPRSISKEDAADLQLHEGFHDRACGMMKEFNRFVGSAQFTPQSRVIVVGHSLGGAVATLFGMALAWQRKDQFKSGQKNIWICTFGSPRCFLYTMVRPERPGLNDRDAGNRDHSENSTKFEKQLANFLNKPEFSQTIKMTRIKAHADPVTSVPFTTMGENLCRHVTPFTFVLERDSEMRGHTELSSTICDMVIRMSTADDETKAKEYIRKIRPVSSTSTADTVFSAFQFVVCAPNHKMASYKGRLTEVVGVNRQNQNGDWIDGIACQPGLWSNTMLQDESWWTATEKEDDTLTPAGSNMANWTLYQINKLARLGLETALTRLPLISVDKKNNVRKAAHNVHKIITIH